MGSAEGGSGRASELRGAPNHRTMRMPPAISSNPAPQTVSQRTKASRGSVMRATKMTARATAAPTAIFTPTCVNLPLSVKAIAIDVITPQSSGCSKT